MADPREIPGFFYDHEKRKYFKVEAHGNPSNPYSKENIAKRRRAAEEEARLTSENSFQKRQLESLHPLQRWIKEPHNLLTHLNSREFGLPRTLERQGSLEMKMMERNEMRHLNRLSAVVGQMTTFVVDEDFGHILFGTTLGFVYAVSRNSPNLSYNNSTVTMFTSPVTSISLSLQNPRTLVCCSLGDERASGTLHVGTVNPGDERSYGLDFQASIKPRRNQGLFCTAVSRYRPDLFAFGGEDTFFIACGMQEDFTTFKVRSNCLALDFLGDYTLAVGFRNGSVRVYDIRAKQDHDMKALNIFHPSSVTNIRQVEDHLLVVAGLENSLAMYDVRNLKRNVEFNSLKPNTIPVVRYSGHVNSVVTGLGFDLSPNGSILAVAGEDRFVRLWSVYTGQRIHAKISENPFEYIPVGLQFSRQHDTGLWIGGGNIEWWDI